MRGMSVLQIALLAVLAGAITLFAGIWAFQRWGVYHFDRVVETPEGVGLPRGRVAAYMSPDGTETTVWLADPVGDMPVILSFHGGYSSIGPSALRMRPLVEMGYGLAVMQYRGSGADMRRPSQASFDADALALYDGLDTLFGRPVSPARRVLHGLSLGTSIATRLAAVREFRAVILEATFPEVCMYFQRRYRGFPFCRLMWAERNDVISSIGLIRAPILVAHGGQDTSIPPDWGRAVFDAATSEKEFLLVPDAGHADLDRFGLVEAADRFIRDHAP